MTHRWAIEFEGVASVEGPLSGQSQNGGSGPTTGTLGLGYQITRFIKLEAGATLKSDQTQQVMPGLVYTFSGNIRTGREPAIDLGGRGSTTDGVRGGSRCVPLRHLNSRCWG